MVELSAQALLHKHVQSVAQCLNTDVIYHFACKGIHQQVACLVGEMK